MVILVGFILKLQGWQFKYSIYQMIRGMFTDGTRYFLAMYDRDYFISKIILLCPGLNG